MGHINVLTSGLGPAGCIVVSGTVCGKRPAENRQTPFGPSATWDGSG